MIFNVNLNKECNSIIPSKQCLPQIIVLDNFLEEIKDYVENSIIYETIEFKIKFNEFPELLDLIKSHKFFMYYLHIPKKMREYGLQKEDFFLMKK